MIDKKTTQDMKTQDLKILYKLLYEKLISGRIGDITIR